MAQLDQDGNLQLREKLVNTAVKFLQNPKVHGSPLKQKQDFLRRKGLTEEEIQRACEIAAVPEQSQHEYTAISMPNQIYPYHSMQTCQPSLFHKIREILNTVVLFGATFYGVYWFYKKFIAPFLFGRKKKDPPSNPVSEVDNDIQTSIKQLHDSMTTVESDVHKLTQTRSSDPTVSQLVQELKLDVASLKSLLLSRKQFPAVPASIPSWQLETTTSPPEKSTEREDDAGSGSSTNNSDSSLEMIREDPPKD